MVADLGQDFTLANSHENAIKLCNEVLEAFIDHKDPYLLEALGIYGLCQYNNLNYSLARKIWSWVLAFAVPILEFEDDVERTHQWATIFNDFRYMGAERRYFEGLVKRKDYYLGTLGPLVQQRNGKNETEYLKAVQDEQIIEDKRGIIAKILTQEEIQTRSAQDLFLSVLGNLASCYVGD
jgi:hypothetical protein